MNKQKYMNIKKYRGGILLALLRSRKGFIGLWADVFKGFLAGFICGVIVLILIVLKVIPFPFSIC